MIEQNATALAEQEIERRIDVYRQSIDAADIALAKTIWSMTPKASFIHPRGHERGWEEVAANFYGNTMGDLLYDRHLSIGPVQVKVFGAAAIAEFDWNFTATLKDGDAPLKTTGRESQVWIKAADNDWRLVHVHYSGPPQIGGGEGF